MSQHDSKKSSPRPNLRGYLVTWHWAGDRHSWTDFVWASSAKRAERRVRKNRALKRSGAFRCSEILVTS